MWESCVSRSVCESAVSLYPCVNVVGRIGVTLLWCSVLGMLCHCCVPLRSAVCQEMCSHVSLLLCVSEQCCVWWDCVCNTVIVSEVLCVHGTMHY